MRRTTASTSTQAPAKVMREFPCRHDWFLFRLSAVFVLAVAIGACGGEKPEAEAENVIDAFYEALESSDAEAASAAFTADGVFVDKYGAEWTGRSEIGRFVEQAGPKITKCERAGSVEAIGDSTFSLPIEFTFFGQDYAAEAILTIEDGLIARSDWATNP